MGPIIRLIDPAENDASSLDPARIKSFYGVTGVGSASISQSVYEGIGQTASPSDLSTFQKQFGLDSEAIATVVGGHVNDFICSFNPNSCAEANLDVQYMLAMAPGSPLTYSYDASTGPVFEDWITNLAPDSNPPVVNSISYGAPEPKLQASTLNSFNYQVVIAGNTYGVSGTSASAPVVAGFATLVNSRLAEQGKPTIGFLNPTLYANGGAFNDIVTGDNKCSAGGGGGPAATCCSEGFNAVEGWDAATGLGSVEFSGFSQMFGVSSSVVV